MSVGSKLGLKPSIIKLGNPKESVSPLLLLYLFIYLFWPHPQHAEVPKPGTEPAPPQ